MRFWPWIQPSSHAKQRGSARSRPTKEATHWVVVQAADHSKQPRHTISQVHLEQQDAAPSPVLRLADAEEQSARNARKTSWRNVLCSQVNVIFAKGDTESETHIIFECPGVLEQTRRFGEWMHGVKQTDRAHVSTKLRSKRNWISKGILDHGEPGSCYVCPETFLLAMYAMACAERERV